MALIGRDAILAANDIFNKTVPVPEWEKDGEVMVWTMNGSDRELFENAVVANREDDPEKSEGNFRALLAIFSVKDEDGVPLFVLDDMKALRKKSGTVLRRIADASLELNKMSSKDHEALVKN